MRFAYIKLFQTVGERYSEDYINKTGWQYSHQWNGQQRDDYVTWLAQELVTRNITSDVKESQHMAMHFAYKNGWQIGEKVRAYGRRV